MLLVLLLLQLSVAMELDCFSLPAAFVSTGGSLPAVAKSLATRRHSARPNMKRPRVTEERKRAEVQQEYNKGRCSNRRKWLRSSVTATLGTLSTSVVVAAARANDWNIFDKGDKRRVLATSEPPPPLLMLPLMQRRREVKRMLSMPWPEVMKALSSADYSDSNWRAMFDAVSDYQWGTHMVMDLLRNQSLTALQEVKYTLDFLSAPDETDTGASAADAAEAAAEAVQDVTDGLKSVLRDLDDFVALLPAEDVATIERRLGGGG